MFCLCSDVAGVFVVSSEWSNTPGEFICFDSQLIYEPNGPADTWLGDRAERLWHHFTHPL